MNDVDWKLWIRRSVKCCACGSSLQDSRHINFVGLNKLATWPYPRWGNILAADKYPTNRASAIICDHCVEELREPKFAVEWDNNRTHVRYHKVEDLKDLPRITDREVLEAETRLSQFWGGST